MANTFFPDISTLRIQGAEQVARAGLSSLHEKALSSHETSSRKLYSELCGHASKLLALRPTEPMLYNVCNYVLHETPTGSFDIYRRHLLHQIGTIRSKLDVHRKYIIDVALTTLKFPLNAFTHCHSATVTDILINAKQKGRKVIVHNTETRPLFQGRKTATELALAGIPVYHYVDSAARMALKGSDVVLIGCDSITPNKVINKIGSEGICELANSLNVPVYVCTHSLKYDPRALFGKETPIEKRDSKEIWAEAPRGVHVVNPAFEQIDPDLIAGIISELGVLSHEDFLTEVRKEYPWTDEITKF